MIFKTRLTRRMGGIAVALAALATWAAPARADLYAYSEQTISGLNLAFNGSAAGSVQNLQVLSSNFAVSNAPPPGVDGFVDGADSPQAFVGAIAPPPENTFSPVGPTTSNYVRGDELVTPNFTLNTVAEGTLTDFGSSSGIGSLSITGDLVVTSSGTVTLSFTGSNLLNIIETADPLGVITASLTFNFVIQNASDGIVFQASPSQLNRTIGLNNEVGNNTVGLAASPFAITTGTLAAGTYQASLSVASRVALTAVPEPASMSMLVMGGLSLAGFGLRGRKAKLA